MKEKGMRKIKERKKKQRSSKKRRNKIKRRRVSIREKIHGGCGQKEEESKVGGNDGKKMEW